MRTIGSRRCPRSTDGALGLIGLGLILGKSGGGLRWAGGFGRIIIRWHLAKTRSRSRSKGRKIVTNGLVALGREVPGAEEALKLSS
jgi:hypothetical protein